MSMVDVSKKPEVFREAMARGIIRLRPETIRLIKEGKVEKGDVFSLAKVAGVLAAKKTSELVPLCHPLPLSNVDVKVEIVDEARVAVEATVKAFAKTGVEMEALVAVSAALLTVWDMTKQYEKDSEGQYPTTAITDVKVLQKVKRG
ncbi:MAG: cyclic pyranopterin monophosphate synthase MoaC [Candidatus Bathyarchaeota archaeon]|nr:cyclic pyranopterin monophosphate synthase MoaC [Candidatus Bathyarchaeota archaeon]MDH5494512.1 cyclic pyranopterin monophosphate synthase MoaC [Candidatus Bathyarchaeota archaeon]